MKRLIEIATLEYFEIEVPDDGHLENILEQMEGIINPHAVLKFHSAKELPERRLAAYNIMQVCRQCGCTDDNCEQCVEAQGRPCHWVEVDLCSRCQESGKPSPEEPDFDWRSYRDELEESAGADGYTNTGL